MKRVIRLDTIEFYPPLFVLEEESPTDIQSSMTVSASGTHIVYVKQIVTPYITLETRESGWLSEAQVIGLIELSRDLAAEYEIEYTDNTTQKVRIANEKRMTFSPLFEGSCDYTGIITLGATE